MLHGMLKKIIENALIYKFVFELLGRREAGLPSAKAKTNELTPKQVHMRGFVLTYTSIV